MVPKMSRKKKSVGLDYSGKKMNDYDSYFETCDLCEKDDFSIQDLEILITNDNSRIKDKTLTFLCFSCNLKLRNLGYVE